MQRIRIATVVFCVLLLIQIVRAVRREHIRVEISMGWFAATALLLALSLSDRALNLVSGLLGVRDPSFVLLLVAGVLFLSTFFRFSVEVSTLKEQNIVLAQKLGLIEWEVKRQAAEIERVVRDHLMEISPEGRDTEEGDAEEKQQTSAGNEL
ncbi:MAG: DUF2304 domain-containing protein [Acidobacteria bacterium]|nr:DUF2304 domain-containing protein [Acidobacteriota bacterium]